MHKVHSPRTVRPLWLIPAGVIAGVLALTVWHFWPLRQKYPVALPSAAASQRQVVLAYLRSLDAHDSATALALSAPGMRDTTRMWLAKTASITRIQVGALQCPAAEPPTEQCSVSVNFVYRSHFWKEDPSFDDGAHYWGYYLERIGGRWLITDDGTG